MLTEEQENQFDRIRKEHNLSAAFSVQGVKPEDLTNEVPDHIEYIVFVDWYRHTGKEFKKKVGRKPSWFALWKLHSDFLDKTENERHIYFEGYEPDEKGRPGYFKISAGS